MSDDIRVVQFSKYIRPKIKENDYMNWVENGNKNDFYRYIIDCLKGSPTHASICNTYSKLIYGRGLAIHDTDKVPKILDYVSKKDLKSLCMDKQVFNEFAIQVIKNRGGGLDKLVFLPKNKVIPAVANDDCEIEGYWYSKDWSKRYQTKYKPEYFPAFGTGEGNEPEIYVGKPYTISSEYFADPDYISIMQYAELEEEISNFYINHIKNGLSFGTIVTIPESANWDETKKEKYINDVRNKGVGSSNANRVTVVFAESTEQVTISNVDGNDSHLQFDVLSTQAREKILTGHRCPSPSIVGVISSTGFASTAEEMDMGEQQLMKRVIAPKQDDLIDDLKEISEYFGIDEDIYFRPLTEVEGEDEEKGKVNKEQDGGENEKTSVDENVEMSAVCDCEKKKDDLGVILESLAEDEPEGFELHQIDFNLDETVVEFASTANSEQDTDKWKIRYAYNIGTSKRPIGKSRDFCNRMMKLSKQGKVFRKEDIDKMSADGVNGQFAHEGGKYDIFLYAGGVNCHHRWERRIYKKKTQDNGKLYGGNAMQNVTKVNVSEARRQGAKIPTNPRDVAIAEIDKPNRGSLK